jgi:MFS family permease
MTSKAATVLLNIAHAVDHMFLLIFAAAVAAIAADFGLARWEDLMPYGTGAFVLYGLGALPAGRLGDLWGRRSMMVLFFFGMGVSALLCAVTRTPWELAGALTLVGAFAAIYHPVGIPMLLQRAQRPGATIGLNGLVAISASRSRRCSPACWWTGSAGAPLSRRRASSASPSGSSSCGWCRSRPSRRRGARAERRRCS